MPVAEKPGFVSYSIQKFDRPDANYMLFWLQSSSSEHTLGIVGRDARHNKKWKYKTHPDLTAYPAYTSDTKNEVLVWLASIGAEHMVPAKKATSFPTMTEDDWLKLQPKAAKAAVAAKEAAEKPSQTAAKPKETAPKAKELAPKAKETAASKPKGRPRKKAKVREICMYCSKTSHASEDCPVKLAAEEGHGSEDEEISNSEGEDKEAEAEQSCEPETMRHQPAAAPQRSQSGRDASYSPEVQDAYEHDPDLLRWVSGSLDQEKLELLTRWSTQLTGIVSPNPPQEMHLDSEGQPLRWLPTNTAINILRKLESEQVTLRLLELSQISMPVAMLRNNASAEVATLAKTLAKRWRELAVAALDCATKALERRA